MWSLSKQIAGFCALTAAVACCGLVFAQELEISGSPVPVGSGARAAGMADAFVAIADDATAASWNPAGLVQLERPEFSIVGSWNGIHERFRTDGHGEFETRHFDDNFDLNYLSFAYPLPFLILGRNATVSLNYQRKYDFSRSFDARLDTASALMSGRVLNRFQRLDFAQTGGLSAISPAVAIEITHRLSVGVAFNFWRSTFLSDNSWEQRFRAEEITFFGPLPILALRNTKEEYKDFAGENFTLGVLWNPVNRWSFGLRYDTGFEGKARYKRSGYGYQMNLPSMLGGGFLDVWPLEKKENRRIRFPDTVAMGVACRVNDRLTLALDAARTDWKNFYVKDANGQRFSLVDFSNLDDRWARTRLKPTYTVRLGTEYVFLPKQPKAALKQLWSVRGGLFYDQEPATGKSSGFTWPWERGSGKPDGFWGFAAGTGVQFLQRVNIDFAYQFRCGLGVNADYIRGVSGFKEDVIQHRVLLSTVVYL